MKTNFFEYGICENVGLQSPSKPKNVLYPNVNYSFKNTCKCFYHEHYDNNIPLVSPIMDSNELNGNIILNNDYEPSLPIMLKNSSTTVNLNGNKIIAPVFAESNGEIYEGNTDSYCFWVKEGGELTIEGDGEIIANEANYSMAVWADGGKVIINGGKFFNNGDNSDLIYASKDGHVEIYGGEFHANENTGAAGTKNRYPALNIKDKDRGTAKIVVYGGKFFGFNPANNLSEGPNTNFVAEGYKSVEIEENVFEVQKSE